MVLSCVNTFEDDWASDKERLHPTWIGRIDRIIVDIRIQIELVAVADPSRSTGTVRPKGYQPLPGEARHLAEVSIGHGLSADALIYGMAAKVKRFRGLWGRR